MTHVGGARGYVSCGRDPGAWGAGGLASKDGTLARMTELPEAIRAAIERARKANAKGDHRASQGALEEAFTAVDFPAKGPIRCSRSSRR